MKKSLQDLYDLPPVEPYLSELAKHCERLEWQILELAERLQDQERMLLVAYIDLRDELQFQSVKRALKFRSKTTTKII